jgi:hypothetical protein
MTSINGMQRTGSLDDLAGATANEAAPPLSGSFADNTRPRIIEALP